MSRFCTNSSFINVCGNSTTIIRNGEVISNHNEDMKEINKKETIKANSIRSINIESGVADVEVLSSEINSEIRAILAGNISFNSDINLIFLNENGILNITVESDKIFNYSNLNLKVFVPKKEYDSIFANLCSGDIRICANCYVGKTKITSTSGDISILGINTQSLEIEGTNGEINIGKEIFNKYLKVNSVNGYIKVKSAFEKANLTSTSGDVELVTYAKDDFALNISTVSGEVRVKLKNVGDLKLSTKKVLGDVRNTHLKNGKYTAKVNISTVCGDIKVK